MRRDTGVYGTTFIESGAIDGWVEFCQHELEVPLCVREAWRDWKYMGGERTVQGGPKACMIRIFGCNSCSDRHLLCSENDVECLDT